MAEPRTDIRVVPVLGIIGPSSWDSRLDAELNRVMGQALIGAGPIPFTFTRYYEPEMGAPLFRRFLAFEPCDPVGLLKWKQECFNIERRFLRPGGRRAYNLDPGYVTLGSLVLASFKPAPHRACIGPGTFAEVTLLFEKGRWTPLPWTFPDFRAGAYDRFLTDCREILKYHLAASPR